MGHVRGSVARGGVRKRRGRSRLVGLHRDQRGLVTGFIVRTVLIFVILVACLEEVGQVVVAQIHASNAAGLAAQAGADDYYFKKNANHAQAMAQAALTAKDPKAKMLAFSVAKDGTVTVTVSVVAGTIFIQHLPYVKTFCVQESTEMEFHSLA